MHADATSTAYEAAAPDGGFASVRIEVRCPEHGLVVAELTDETGPTGPPCSTCGAAATVYPPMLALALACRDAARRIGPTAVLQLLR
jgi:hypothetical protein